MLRNPAVHAPDGAISQIKNSLCPFAAKFFVNLAHRPAQPGDQLTAVPARRAKTDILRLKQRDLQPLFRAGQRCGKARESTADDRNVIFTRSRKCRLWLPRIGGSGIITVVERIGHYTLSSKCSRSQLLTTDW